MTSNSKSVVDPVGWLYKQEDYFPTRRKPLRTAAAILRTKDRGTCSGDGQKNKPRPVDGVPDY